MCASDGLVELETDDPGKLDALCEKLLANPLIEDFEIVGFERWIGSSSSRAPATSATRWSPCSAVGEQAGLARGDRPLGPRRGDRSRRLLLRRLPASGGDRPLLACDGGGRAASRPRAGRCSGSATASRCSARRAAARRPAAQRGPAVHLPAGGARPEDFDWAVRRRRSSRRAALDPDQAHERALLRSATRCSTRWRRAARSPSATPPARTRTASVRDIAGVVNEAGNVLGLMPHPEQAVESLTGADDGLRPGPCVRRAAQGLLRGRRPIPKPICAPTVSSG